MLESLIRVNDPVLYLGDEEHDEGDVDGEHDGERGECERGVLLRGQDHGDRSCNHAQNLKERTSDVDTEEKTEGRQQGESINIDPWSVISPNKHHFIQTGRGKKQPDINRR